MRKAGESVPCCVCNATLQFTNRAPLDSFQNSLLTPCAEEGLWLNAAQVLLDRFLLFNQTGMIRRWALEKTGGFDESLRHMEDYDLALRLSLLGPFAFVASPLVVYNGGSAGSLTEEALGNVGRIKENVLKIRQRISQTVMASNRHTELRLPMHRSLRKARRELWVAQLRHRRIPGAAIMSHYLARAEHYFGAVVDRSPWFEKMKTVTICGNPLRPENPCDATRTREFVQ
jgi:GT2 family glycosyltransferase